MFATATFHGKKLETHAAVPASAVLDLHDRFWVYLADPGHSGQYKRIEVTTGASLPNSMLEIVSGIEAGQQVVSNALQLQNTVEQ
jgi:cobalt-zinc-cadmium efflux system membrane fusion protein